MNKVQRKILVAVAAAVGGMLLYPPYRLGQRSFGFGWICDPPYQATGIDVAQLLTQWLGVVLIGIIAFALARSWGERSQRESVISDSDSDAAKIVSPPRGPWIRAVPWTVAGFAIGFVSSGSTLIADFSKRVGGGVLAAVVIYLIAALAYRIFKPIDRGDGAVGAMALRIVVVAVVAAIVGLVMAIAMPAGGHLVYD